MHAGLFSPPQCPTQHTGSSSSNRQPTASPHHSERRSPRVGCRTPGCPPLPSRARRCCRCSAPHTTPAAPPPTLAHQPMPRLQDMPHDVLQRRPGASLRAELRSYVSLPGALCMVAGGWLALAASHCSEAARAVSEAYVLDSLADARKLESLLPMLVALRGRVESNDPRKCELSERRAVIHEVHEEDILLVKGPTGAPERKPFDTRHETSECEWFLADDSACPIKVVRGREASPTELATVMEVAQEYNEQREGVKHSPMQTVSQIITGGRYQGHKKTETFLPVGAIVSVVGELARNTISSSSGSAHAYRYLLQPPSRRAGSPFVITNKTITELHLSLAQRAGTYKRLAWCLGGLGAFLVIRKAARHAWLRWREHQARERVRKALQQQQQQHEAGAAAAAAADSGRRSSTGASLLDVEEGGDHGASAAAAAGLCVVCLSVPSEVVFVRCGHMCCCERCCSNLPSRRCPVCRSEGAAIKVFRT